MFFFIYLTLHMTYVVIATSQNRGIRAEQWHAEMSSLTY